MRNGENFNAVPCLLKKMCKGHRELTSGSIFRNIVDIMPKLCTFLINVVIEFSL